MSSRRPLLLCALLALPAASARAASWWRAEDATAIQGHDPVAYFTEGRPVRGSATITHAWQGETWRFASTANRDLFAADPARYAPAYGGGCAWAVSQGYTAPIDPEAWAIVDGRLFLNYSRAIQVRWQTDVTGNIVKGDRNWPALKTGKTG